MGEKLLAQRILQLLRDTSGRKSKVIHTLLDWAQDERDWLWPGKVWADETPGQRRRATKGATIDWESLPTLTAAIDTSEPRPALFDCVDAVASLLDLDQFELEVLRVGAALARLPRLAALRMRLSQCREDMVTLAGRLAGAELADAAGRVRRSDAVALGFLTLKSESGYGGQEIGLHWRFADLLDDGPVDESGLIDALAGIRQSSDLAPDDFVEHSEAFKLLERLLAGAIERKAAGVNILIHGPPGTGKTEFARALASALGFSLFAVGEMCDRGEEPSRFERLHALKRAQRLLARRGDSLILFDEMEDLFSEANQVAGGGRRAGSKIFVNRLLESNAVPTIWTTNAIGDVDPAHLRRMSFVLRIDYPAPRARARIVARAAEAEGVGAAAQGLAPFVGEETQTASIARAALRSAALAGGGAEDAEAVARSLLIGLRGGRPFPPGVSGEGLDLGLYESDPAIGPLVERLASPGAAADFSLLLTGPPGTGKTALAAHVARRLDRPLAIKRASDLLSMWVGGTEANIAAAFAEARDGGSVLLFDEVDSLLLDRANAHRSWEITQVNELLTWMDSHPLPFIAATNWPNRLDPAALRRFVFKIELGALSGTAMERAWLHFFEGPAPAVLQDVPGLTPGDFALVARQLRYRPEATHADVLAMLEAEARAKPDRPSRVGF